jgi:hypothetical protein
MKNSYYYDVMEPSVEQQGSHMIMKNVSKTIKEKIVNIDTKYRNNASNIFVFGERLSEVRSLEVVSIDIPYTFFNFFGANHCTTGGNNYLRIKQNGSFAPKVLTITPNNYPTTAALATEINLQLTTIALAADISFSVVNNKSFFKSKTNSYSLATNIDICGNTDELNNLNNFGYALGFRDTSYNLTTAGLLSETLITLKTPRHLFLVLNEFSQGNANAFVSPQENTNQNKNIVAKISLPNNMVFGDTLCANKVNGLLASEVRKYLEKVNIQKMQLVLLDDAGRIVELNGADFSVCLKIIHE